MTETRRRRARRAVVAAAACAAALPTAPALAAPDQLSLIEDEKLMLESGAATQAQALDEAKALGADVIRANVIWSRYAPVPDVEPAAEGLRRQGPERVSADLAMLDSLVAGAQARGMQVLLTPTGPIPAWASRCEGSLAIKRVCKPNPQLFGQFVRALGTRYPTVKLWSIWNEPNLRSWLRPQYEVSGSQAVQKSASLYRALATSAIAGPARRPATATRRSGSARPRRSATIPPAARAQRSLRVPARCASRILKTSPEMFLRGVFCLNSGGGRLTGAEGRDQRCSNYKQLRRDRLRASPVHPRRLAAAAVAHQHGRDHDRRGLAAHAPARPGGAREADPGRGCRSTTPSTAGRRTRRTGSSA